MAPLITTLHPSLGAEVHGIDLRQPVDEPTRQTLTRALAEHLVLVFHDQSLTPAQYLTAAAIFGPPMEQHYSQHNMPDFPLIGLIWHRNGQQPAEQWHTDHTNRERPPAATMLYGVEIPSAGGGTSVAGNRLPPPLAQGRRARHRQSRDDAPRARRLRSGREPDALAHYRRGRSPPTRAGAFALGADRPAARRRSLSG
jgi:alpha-ketoglutarate-dependent taurine dioxygenase